MKNKKVKNKELKKQKREFNKGTIFVRIMAGILAILMLVATCASLIFALI